MCDSFYCDIAFSAVVWKGTCSISEAGGLNTDFETQIAYAS